ncbi:tRNA adenosine(34) deaminase TadA [Umboniibacter marinipuniceus]|uniref:tRNA-specific adenosine deaminase n=1 Tax=Umboniibacter marinipuniceus TaxID=569599 RepID=A0A3M0A2F8_9GAMM|nr:tRNA-adenosine deaminase [Umboniibacter marinipuniceus]
MNDNYFMSRALELAAMGADINEVPVGAVVVLDGEIIGEGFNQPITTHDPTAHAEMVALRQAAKNLQNYRLPEAEIYITMEPCSMCAGAIVHSRVKRVIFGADEPKSGVAKSQANFFKSEWLNAWPEVEGGVLAEEAKVLLQGFFKRRRAEKKAEKLAKQVECDVEKLVNLKSDPSAS